jgi:deoxyribonucleoside regulator
VAVAAGRRKVEAILGALRTGCVDVLVTDEPTADAILKHR